MGYHQSPINISKISIQKQQSQENLIDELGPSKNSTVESLNLKKIENDQNFDCTSQRKSDLHVESNRPQSLPAVTRNREYISKDIPSAITSPFHRIQAIPSVTRNRNEQN